MDQDKPVRRVRAGQPAPPILLDPEDTDHQDELPTWISALIVVGIMLAVGACAVFVVRWL
jgi:hypothetical protein